LFGVAAAQGCAKHQLSYSLQLYNLFVDAVSAQKQASFVFTLTPGRINKRKLKIAPGAPLSVVFFYV